MRAIHCGLALAVVLGLTLGLNAADPAKPKKPTGTQGVIEKVEDGKSVTIKTGGKKDPNAASKTYMLTKDTKFVIQGEDGNKDGTASDLKAGARVAIDSETKDGADYAKTVTITMQKKKKP